MLSAFVVAQIVFDVAIVALAVVYLLTRQAPRAPEPPEWYAHFLKLAQELMSATEPVLERLESRGRLPNPSDMGPHSWRTPNPSAPAASATAVVADRYEQARAMLRSGGRPEIVARQAGLQPGEMRLLTRIVEAESRPRSG